MKFSIPKKLSIVFGIITLLVINSAQAADERFFEEDTSDEIEKTTSDDFYLIIVDKNEGGQKAHAKREEKEQVVDNLVSIINNLIVDNMDTYEDTTELEKLEQAPQPSLRRRGEKGEEDEEENQYAHVISSIDDQAIILSYFSEDLVDLVNDLPNVKAVIPDIELNLYEKSNENLKNLKSTSSWESPCVKGNTYNYLSLISQDKYDDSKNSTSYDKNYYYPGSAGKDINIFLLDTGFNFNHFEFSNTDERDVQCLVSTDHYGVYDEYSEECTYRDGRYHGHEVADIAAGLTNGVASKANVYGISVYRGNRGAPISAFIRALEYIDTKYLDSSNPELVKKYFHKSVVNISSGFEFTEHDKLTDEEGRVLVFSLYNIIDNMSNKGTVFVVAAGNESSLSDDMTYPCAFNNVICVGATDNIGLNDYYNRVMDIRDNRDNSTKYPTIEDWVKDYEDAMDKLNKQYNDYIDTKEMSSKYYRTAYFSNYGKMVNIYAPGFIKAYYKDESGKDVEVRTQGTSFSSPIVAGVAATIMSEFPKENYDTKKMLKKLNEIGIQDAIKGIKKDHPNVFVNNGKKVTYSQSDLYNSCGSSKNQLCTKDGELQCFQYGCCLRSDVE